MNMSFEYTDKSGDTLSISGSPAGAVLIARMKDSVACNYIAKADAPAVAAELLKAAGHDNLADLVGWESAEKKLQERRDALAKRFTKGICYYESAELSTKAAIDYIIEDGK